MPKLKPDHISLTEEEDAAMESALANDPEEQGWVSVGPLQPVKEVFPELVAASKRMRGKQKAPTKVKVPIRLDAAVVEHFRATGPGWQSRINEILRQAALGE